MEGRLRTEDLMRNNEKVKREREREKEWSCRNASIVAATRIGLGSWA